MQISFDKNLLPKDSQENQNDFGHEAIEQNSSNEFNIQLSQDLLKRLLKKVGKVISQKNPSQLAYSDQILQLAIQELESTEFDVLIQSFEIPCQTFWLEKISGQQGYEKVQKPSIDYLIVRALIKESIGIIKLKCRHELLMFSDQSQFGLKLEYIKSFNLQDALNGKNIIDFLNTWNSIMLSYLIKRKKQVDLKNYARIFGIKDYCSLKQMIIYVFVKSYLYQDHKKRLLYAISSEAERQRLFPKQEEKQSSIIFSSQDEFTNSEQKQFQNISSAQVYLPKQLHFKNNKLFSLIEEVHQLKESNYSQVTFDSSMQKNPEEKKLQKVQNSVEQPNTQNSYKLADEIKRSESELSTDPIIYQTPTDLEPSIQIIQETFDKNRLSQEQNIIQSQPKSKNYSEQDISYVPFNLNVSQQKSFDQVEINSKVFYFFHLIQFFNEILSEFSSSNNIIIASSFNCSRFLILNLMPFFMFQTITYIEQDILKRHGQLYFEAFLRARDKFKKFQDGLNKINQSIKLSSQKIQNYLSNIDKPKNEKNPNLKKLEMIFQNNPSLKKLYFELNDPQIIQKYENGKSFFKQFNFEKTKQIYSEAIRLLMKESFSKKIFERTVNSKFAKKTEYIEFFQKYKITLKSFDNIDSIKTKTTNEKKTFKKILAEYTIIHLESLKSFAQITTLPFYSFENQRQNLRRTNKNKYNDQTSSIFKNLDKIYIYFIKKCKFNTNFLIANHDSTMEIIYEKYVNNLDDIMTFIFEQNFSEKQNMLTLKQSSQSKIIANEKPIHDQRMAIFSQEECISLFYVTHQIIKQPFVKYEILEEKCKEKWQNQKKSSEIKANQKSNEKSKSSGVTTEKDNYIDYMRNFRKNMTKILPLYKKLYQEIIQLNAEKELDKKKNNNFRKNKQTK